MSDFKKQRLLVIAPHPDDELFGCGGLIHRIKKAGGKVFVLFLTVGTTKDFSKKGSSTEGERVREITRVAKFMSYDGWHLAFPGDEYHLKLDALPQKMLIDMIERESPVSIEKVRPTILAMPSTYDHNQDHRAVNCAAITATRPAPSGFRHFVPTVIEYEFPYFAWTSETDRPSPDVFLALDAKALQAKLRALKLYSSQMKIKNGPISVHGAETLAHMRGIQSGTDHAEAYNLRRSFLL